MHSIDRTLPEGKNKKSNWINERRIRWKNRDKIGSDDKNAKDTKKCLMKRKLNLQDYKNYLEAVQLENKKHHLEKIQADSLKELVKKINKYEKATKI